MTMADKVFTFGQKPVTPINKEDEKKTAEITYQTFESDAEIPDTEHPILVLDNGNGALNKYAMGVFAAPG